MIDLIKYLVQKRCLKQSAFLLVVVFSYILICLVCSDGFAQVREEIDEKKSGRIEIESLQREVNEKKEKKKYKLVSSLELSSSYETNPRFTTVKKGDSAGHLRYNLLFRQPVLKGFLLNFNYNLDGSGYSELNDLTNILNHARLTIDKSMNKFLSFGFGYDFSSFYYPDEQSGDFYFHKGVVYLKHNFSRNLFQQIGWEEGAKDYIHSSANAHSLTTYQDTDRRDYRHGVEYSLGMNLSSKMFFRFRTKYSINDSNAFYQDYYDYKSLDFSPYFSYQFSKKYSMNFLMTFSGKTYKNRLVGAQTDERHDQSYNGNVGLKYSINKNNSVNLSYGYIESHSNDPTTEFNNSTISGGWQYKF